jgi:hypothetical protein
MDATVMQEIFHEFISSLEALDAHTSAISEFLRDKNIVNPEELAPYLERAANASSVRWLAARVRIDYLFSSSLKQTGEGGESPEAGKATKQTPSAGSGEKKVSGNEKSAGRQNKNEDTDDRKDPEESNRGKEEAPKNAA